MEGDFVDIGRGGNGFQLDFFLISNGANGGTTWLWNDIDKNSDKLQHVVAYHVPGSSLILIGFEDISVVVTWTTTTACSSLTLVSKISKPIILTDSSSTYC